MAQPVSFHSVYCTCSCINLNPIASLLDPCLDLSSLSTDINNKVPEVGNCSLKLLDNSQTSWKKEEKTNNNKISNLVRLFRQEEIWVLPRWCFTAPWRLHTSVMYHFEFTHERMFFAQRTVSHGHTHVPFISPLLVLQCYCLVHNASHIACKSWIMEDWASSCACSS